MIGAVLGERQIKTYPHNAIDGSTTLLLSRASVRREPHAPGMKHLAARLGTEVSTVLATAGKTAELITQLSARPT